MTLHSKIGGILFLTSGGLIINHCIHQNNYQQQRIPEETAPQQYAVPLFFVPSEEVHSACATETVQCNYYSDYGPVFVFKCRTAENKLRIYVSEISRYEQKLWYETKLRQDINNYTFSEYCKSTFDHYKWFRQKTEK